MSKDNTTNPYRNPNKIHQANQHQIKCVYRKKSDHKSADSQAVKTTYQHRKLLRGKKLCFNCTKPKHRAADCAANCRNSRT